MKEANRIVFERLKTKLPTDIVSSELRDQPRWIDTDDEEMDFLLHCVVEEFLTVLPSKLVFAIRYRDRYFVGITQQPSTSQHFMVGVLKQVNDNAGLLTVIWGLDKYPLASDEELGFKLAEYIFGRSKGYSLKNDEGPFNLRHYFAPHDIWEIDTNHFGMSDIGLTELHEDPSQKREYKRKVRTLLFRVFGGYLLNDGALLTLPYSEETLTKMKMIFEDSSSEIVGEVVFKALTATHWEHAFLELYRSIERLYPIPIVEKLWHSLERQKSIGELSMLVEQDLNWRPRQDEALIGLLDYLDDDRFISPFKNPLNVNSQAENTNKAVAKAIYKLRNNIAHWRSSGDVYHFPDDKDWERVISLLCDLLFALYQKCRHAF